MGIYELAEPYEGAEPYENFSFGDELHIHDDSPGSEGLQCWVGIMPYGAVFEASAWTDADYSAAIVIERPSFIEGLPMFSWMPADTPYWHRASHCPRKEL